MPPARQSPYRRRRSCPRRPSPLLGALVIPCMPPCFPPSSWPMATIPYLSMLHLRGVRALPSGATRISPPSPSPNVTALSGLLKFHAVCFPAPFTSASGFPALLPALLVLSTALASRDRSRCDGTPDFLRLDSPAARAAFRRWFTFLAEAQYFHCPRVPPRRNRRLRRPHPLPPTTRVASAHDSAWASSARLPLNPRSIPPASTNTPTPRSGAALCRHPRTASACRRSQIESLLPAQFADAKTLWRYNTHLVSRDLTRAETEMPSSSIASYTLLNRTLTTA